MQVCPTRGYQRISYRWILGSNSRSLRDSPREFPLYIIYRIPHSAEKHTQSSISSSACKYSSVQRHSCFVVSPQNPYCSQLIPTFTMVALLSTATRKYLKPSQKPGARIRGINICKAFSKVTTTYTQTWKYSASQKLWSSEMTKHLTTITGEKQKRTDTCSCVLLEQTKKHD